MRSTLDCLPCFLSQGLRGARLAVPDNEELQKKVVLTWASEFPKLDLSKTPPEIAGHLYSLVHELLDNPDPFAKEKQEANAKVQNILPRLEEILKQSEDRLLYALKISIIGNYIDSGVAEEFDWENKLLSDDQDLDPESYRKFQSLIKTKEPVLILGDNAGEIALDKLLVRELKKRNCPVTYAVRDKPVINDATLKDAEEVGMTKLCRVISSGVQTPGTVLKQCSSEFLEEMQKHATIISKGQGNYEALTQEKQGIFFAFKVKCAVVAELTGRPVGTSIFLYQ